MRRSDPRATAESLEAAAALPDGDDLERLRGYAVTGLPFRSGHILAMRRFPATSIGPGYTSVWHRDPHGRWVIYQDQPPQQSCPRAFGPAIDHAPVVPIAIEWPQPHHLRLRIDTDEVRLRWEVPLTASRLTRCVNAIADVLPPSLRHSPRFLNAIARPLGRLLRAGRLRLAGEVPSRQRFLADPRQLWLIDGSTAVLDGTDLGPEGPVDEQAHLSDFWVPQRGLFAFVDAFFEPKDPSRHLAASCCSGDDH